MSTTATTAASLPLSVIVLTYNEERNLRACLESVAGLGASMFVVDSGSTDRTVAIARAAGAEVVTHPFETHAAQWLWAMAHLPLTSDWVLALDADHRLTPELQREIRERFSQPDDPSVDGLYVNRRQVFRGRWIRHGGYYPKYLLKLFRRSRVAIDPRDLVDHHFTVNGSAGKLRHDLIEENRNEDEIAVWTAKHNRYAMLQARQEIQALAAGPPIGWRSIFESPDARVRWLKQQWSRFPLLLRPCLYVTYRYLLRAGFLDGRQGFIFHVLQAFWYRLLVDINIQELRAAAGAGAATTPLVTTANGTTPSAAHPGGERP